MMELSAIICHGHQGASGTGPNFGNTCEGGSIRRQDIIFCERGFDLRDWLGGTPFWGSMNCYIGRHAIDPMTYLHEMIKDPQKFPPDYEFDLQKPNGISSLMALSGIPTGRQKISLSSKLISLSKAKNILATFISPILRLREITLFPIRSLKLSRDQCLSEIKALMVEKLLCFSKKVLWL